VVVGVVVQRQMVRPVAAAAQVDTVLTQDLLPLLGRLTP
jgi:hypothetical protein